VVDIGRWVACAALLLLSAAATVTNWALVLRYFLKKRRNSLVPIVGGVAGVLGCLVSPSLMLRAWWWLPLVLDPGAGPLFVATAVSFISGKLRGAEHPE
jgi:hypothetical protein